MMRRLLIIPAFLSLSIACAARAHADEPGCRKLADFQKMVADKGGSSRPLTTRELDFARGVYVAQPETPAMFPKGDSGLWIVADGRAIVVFTRHGEVCERISLGKDGARNFEALETPEGDPS